MFRSFLPQITVVISLIGTNDHSPIFDMPQYTANLREYHALEMTNGAAVNSTVQTVHATDGDGEDTPAGHVEYRIVSGNTINGEKIFEILIPSVSGLAITLVTVNWGEHFRVKVYEAAG